MNTLCFWQNHLVHSSNNEHIRYIKSIVSEFILLHSLHTHIPHPPTCCFPLYSLFGISTLSLYTHTHTRDSPTFDVIFSLAKHIFPYIFHATCVSKNLWRRLCLALYIRLCDCVVHIYSFRAVVVTFRALDDVIAAGITRHDEKCAIHDD